MSCGALRRERSRATCERLTSKRASAREWRRTRCAVRASLRTCARSSRCEKRGTQLRASALVGRTRARVRAHAI
eukprot:6195753-Pleurochrysis_carterae.AAC.1